MQTKKLTIITKLFWPILFSILLTSILSFIDSVMVGNYNVLGISAVSVSAQVQFLFGPIYFATMSGVGIYSVQYFARNETEILKKLGGIALTFLLPVALLNFLVYFFFTNQIISIFLQPGTEVYTLSQSYLLIFKYTVFLIPIDMFFTYQYRAIKKPKIPLIMGTTQALLDILFNFFFIYGIGPFPEMGIEGAAIATLLARIVTFIINVILAYRIKAPFVGKFKNMFNYESSLIKKVFLTTLPLAVVEFGFGLGNALYAKLYSLVGIEGYTAYNVARTISFLINGFVIATASVSGILIGEQISRGIDKDDPELKSTLINLFIFMGLCSLVLLIYGFFIAPYFIRFFTTDSTYVIMIRKLLILNAFWMAIRVFSSSFIAILKSGNDNKFIIVIEIVTVFAFALPLTYLIWFIFKPSVVILRSLIILEVLVKALLGFYRFRKYKWIKKL